MKNLYRRIGVPAYSLPDFVEQAVEGRDDDDAKQARAILLDPWKKKTYDRSLFAASRIAHARYQLGIIDTPHWTHADYEDLYSKPEDSETTDESDGLDQGPPKKTFWSRVAKAALAYMLFMLLVNMCR